MLQGSPISIVGIIEVSLKTFSLSLEPELIFWSISELLLWLFFPVQRWYYLFNEGELRETEAVEVPVKIDIDLVIIGN